ncbi:hypothetical protein O6P43_002720 [Quillaja saponaria]|nr:hypothetical protein O6P43_002720 [Quillaja saponaria]
MDNCTKYAGMAVDYHNSNHKDADFELVEPLNYMYLLHGPYPYAHLNYVARNRNPNCNDTSPVLFFAELNTRNNEFTVCSVVVPGSPLCKIGCGVCRPDGMMYHPLYGCVAGNYCYEAGDLSVPSRYQERVKKHFWELYTSVCTIKVPDANEAYELKSKTGWLAKKALACYNYYRDFELVEIKSAVRFVESETYIWVHLNFMARRKGCSDACPQRFFAEILDHFGYLRVNQCTIVEPDASDDSNAKIKIGCGVCPSFGTLYHPVGKYDTGFSGTILEVMEEKWSCIRKHVLLPVAECPEAHIRSGRIGSSSFIEDKCLFQLEEGKPENLQVMVEPAVRDALRTALEDHTIFCRDGCTGNCVNLDRYYSGSGLLGTDAIYNPNYDPQDASLPAAVPPNTLELPCPRPISNL